MSKDKYVKEFFISLNMQNPPRPPYQLWYVRHADETSDPNYVVASYEFTKELRPDTLGTVDGSGEEQNFRKAFLPEVGHTLVSRDFSGQELRILANLSGEPDWIETFLHDGDIHERTAKSIWGETNYTPDMRTKAKSINFGLAYGIGPQGLANDLNVSEEVAAAYINRFYETHPHIERYLQRQARLAEQNQELANHYGRKRRFHNYFNARGELNGSGARRAYNFPIQSLGADITKLGLLSIYYNILTNPKYEGKVLWMSTIHDEINLSVSNDVLEEVVYQMGVAMEHTILPNMPVPIITGLAMGNNMGVMWGFNQDPETLVLTPAYTPLG